MHHLTEFNKHTNLIAKYGSNAYMLWVLGLYLDETRFGRTRRKIPYGWQQRQVP